jgi:hypothetical protein
MGNTISYLETIKIDDIDQPSDLLHAWHSDSSDPAEPP